MIAQGGIVMELEEIKQRVEKAFGSGSGFNYGFWSGVLEYVEYVNQKDGSMTFEEWLSRP